MSASSRLKCMYGVSLSKKGQDVVANLTYVQRPCTSVTDENVSAVGKLILEDQRCTQRDMAEELGISVGTIDQIIHERLSYHKISVRWVPRLLNFEQKFLRLKAKLHTGWPLMETLNKLGWETPLKEALGGLRFGGSNLEVESFLRK